MLLIFLILWLMASAPLSYAEDDSFCIKVFERCREEALNQDSGFIAQAIAYDRCCQLYYQCLFIFYCLPWLLMFLPYVQ